jgi:DNA/RNA-binding domain of Phe-tRNA-synthetase-like protein
MERLSFSVSDQVFAQFPDYIRGVVLAYRVKNGESPPELVELLRAAEDSVRRQLNLDELTAYPRIASWREAFRAFGAKPSEHRSSIEAMLRRVLRDQALPSVNMLVDIGNIISLQNLVPTGGHALDVVKQDMVLRIATGEEEFVPFGGDQVEHPMPGEIIFAEGATVLTRRWSWRQANHTLLLPGTTAVEFNIDGLPPVSRAHVEDICRQVAKLLEQFCGGEITYDVLTREHPRLYLRPD